MEQLPLSHMPSRLPQLRTLRETPALRVTQSGAKNVSLLELLGTVLGDADVALRLLGQFPTIHDLIRAPQVELGTIKGMGQARVAALQAALELGRRAQLGGGVERQQIRSPQDAADLVLLEMGALEQEEMRVMLLDTRNRVLGVETIYRGNVNSAIVRTSEVFREAVRRNAPSVIIFHAHPSGDPEPSPDDVSTTRTIVEAGKLLDVETLDHIIIGHGRFVSLKERGLGF
jgi:DNA repair protein RadC